MKFTPLERKEKGTGVKSADCSMVAEKSIESFEILGGVPVFKRPNFRSKFSKVLANPIEGASPLLPAGNVLVPIRTKPRKKVPVVSTRHFLHTEPRVTFVVVYVYVCLFTLPVFIC